MATGGTSTSVETLDVSEFASNDELFNEGLELAAKKEDLVAELKGLDQANMSPDNPEYALTKKEIAIVDQDIDGVATQWADKHVWDLIKDPEKRAAAIERKKATFIRRLERKYKRQERKEDRQERREARKAKRHGDETPEENDGSKKRRGRRERVGVAPMDSDVRTPALGGSFEEVEGGAVEGSGTALIVKRMLDTDPPLSPSDLLDGARQEQAIDAVFQDDPAFARSLKQKLLQPQGSPAHQDAIAELTQVKSTLDSTYSVLKKSEVAQEQELRSSAEGTFLHKLSDVASEAVKKPEVLIAGAICAFGLWMVKDKLPWDKIKTVVGGTAVGGASVFLLDFIMEYATGKGLGDRLNIHPSKWFSGEVQKQVQSELFSTMPANRKASVDDLVKIYDTDMGTINDTYETALNHQKIEIDTEPLLGRGLDADVASDINGKELKEGWDWFYEECADLKLQEPGARKPYDTEDKRRMGIEWARDNLKGGYDFKTAMIEVQRRKEHLKSGPASGGDGASADASLASGPVVKPELLIREPHLRDLYDHEPAFHSVLKQLPNGNVAVSGYPYKYYFTDRGEHRFVDALHPEKVVIIPNNPERGDRNKLLSALMEEAALGVKKEFESFTTDRSLALRYEPSSGDWRLNPASERSTHLGLSQSGRETKVPFKFYTDGLGMMASYEGAPETSRFTSLDEVKKDFELKKALPDLVKKDLGHVLLGADFMVVEFTDNEADKSTSIKIQYDSGHEGTLVYKNNVLESSTLDASADLMQRWELQAHKDTVELFSRSTIQDRIIAATNVNPDIYVRWHNVTTNGLVPSEPGIEFQGGLFGTVGKTLDELVSGVLNSNDITGSTLAAREKAETEAKVKQGLDTLAAKMRTELTDLYKKGLSKTDFDQQKKTLMAGYEKDVIKIVGEKVDIVLPPTELTKMKAYSDSQMEEALAPMKHLLTTDRNQVGLYGEVLARWRQKALSEIEALGPNPLKSAVDKVISENYAAASREANPHRGLDGSQSGDVLREAELTGAQKLEWKGPTDKVYRYVSERFNWSSTEVNELMKIYYANIENGGAPATAASADTYATFFMSSVYRIMGTKETNFDRAKQLFVDDFDTKLPVLKGIKSSREYDAHPETLPTPPELKDGKEMYKEHVKEEFTKWFDTNMDLSTWTGIEGDWPNTFRDSVNLRLDRIVMDNTLTSLELSEKVKRFSQFVTVEYALYKICVDGTYEGWTSPIEVRDRIIEKNYDVVWPTSSDYNAYAAKLDKDFGENVAGYQFGLLTRRVLQLATVGAVGAVALLVI